MALTKEDVAGIAAYACIALDEQELEEITSYLNEALELLRPIRAYDLSGVEPTFHPLEGLSNVTAADEEDAHGRALDVETALRNAAATRAGLFRVPSILGDEGGDRP